MMTVLYTEPSSTGGLWLCDFVRSNAFRECDFNRKAESSFCCVNVSLLSGVNWNWDVDWLFQCGLRLSRDCANGDNWKNVFNKQFAIASLIATRNGKNPAITNRGFYQQCSHHSVRLDSWDWNHFWWTRRQSIDCKKAISRTSVVELNEFQFLSIESQSLSSRHPRKSTRLLCSKLSSC